MNQQDSALNVTLPKWPQMLVWGKAVTQAQARDIILRTDSFLHNLGDYYGGNNHEYNKMVSDTLGYTRIKDAIAEQEKLAIESGAVKDSWGLKWNLQEAAQQKIKDAINPIETSYVKNDWTSCAFIYGAHGWCHPDGKIGFVDNVGKWPSAEEVYEDWRKLSAAFPYLDLHVTLMSGESCEDDCTPVITFIVNHGLVGIAETPTVPTDHLFLNALTKSRSAENITYEWNTRSENKLPDLWLHDFNRMLGNTVEEILAEIPAHASEWCAK